MTELSDHHHRLLPSQPLVADLADTNLAGPSGVVWAVASPQMNANLVILRAGDEMAASVNDELDVLIVVESGSGELVIDDERYAIGSASVALIPKGARRSINSETGLAYYSIHQRPLDLSISSPAHE